MYDSYDREHVFFNFQLVSEVNILKVHHPIIIYLCYFVLMLFFMVAIIIFSLEGDCYQQQEM